MADDYGIDDAALEQRLAELSDDDFDALVSRTRPPRLPKGTHVPGVGNSPAGTPADPVAAAENDHDWPTAFALKRQQLARLMRDHR